MAFNNYLEDENDKPYFTTNSLAYYYDKMEGFAKAVEGSAKALNLTKEEVEKRLTLYIQQNKNELDQRLAQWDGKLETFDSSVETLLSEWVDDGTLTHVIDSTLIDQKIAPVKVQLAEKVGGGVVLEPEGFSERSLKLITGQSTINLLTIPQEESVTPEKTNFLTVVSNNLLDTSKDLVGYTISGSTGFPVASASTNLSFFIPVKPNTKYNLEQIFNYGFYQVDQTFIQNLANLTGANLTITTPPNCHRMRVVYYPSRAIKPKVNLGDVSKPHDDYKLGFKNVELLTTTEKESISAIPDLKNRVSTLEQTNGDGDSPITPVESKYKNDIVTVMGTSRTAWNYVHSPGFGINYTELMKESLGIGTLNNRGIGSTQVARKTGYEYDNLSFINRWSNNTPRDSTAVIFEGGVNDYLNQNGGGVPLGSSDVTNRDIYTFYGALRMLIEGVVTAIPKAKLGFITPFYVHNGHVPNSHGHKLVDYVDAILKVCGEYNVKVLDQYRTSGINQFNYTSFLADLVHQNAYGNIHLERQVSEFYKSL